jgi:malate synthase
MPRANGKSGNGHSSLVDEGIVVTTPATPEQASVISADAVRFVADLVRRFRGTRDELLKLRAIRQREIDAGHLPDFLPDTGSIRSSEWTIAPIPPDLQDRLIENTAPVDRETVVEALNSGADTYVADFEDSNSPTWFNCLQGQVNLRDAVRGEAEFARRKGSLPATTLLVRPRALHLHERHLRVDDEPVPASLFDFGLFFFHNAAALLERGSGPYFCIPKIEGHLEARLWNDVFTRAQESLGLPHGSIRAIVLIETVLAVFEMDEILFELRDHAVGLDSGPDDYLFSFIKRFRNRPEFVLPDRALLTTNRHFLESYVDLMIQTCRRRGGHAAGIDRTIAGEAGARTCAADLCKVPEGRITEAGLRANVKTGMVYLESWLGGKGWVRVCDNMADTATAEFSRAQVWHWIRHSARLVDGRVVTRALVQEIVDQELETIERETGQSGRFDVAAKLFTEMTTSEEFTPFMTLSAYGHLE